MIKLLVLLLISEVLTGNDIVDNDLGALHCYSNDFFCNCFCYKLLYLNIMNDIDLSKIKNEWNG